jgi:hydrogenase/urease accessory protein HupE
MRYGFMVPSVLILLGVFAAHAGAHTGGITGSANITIDGNVARYALTLSDIPESPLYSAMRLGEPGIAPDYQPLAKAISEKLQFSTGDGPCKPDKRSVQPPSASAVSLVGSVEFICPATIATLKIRDDMPDVLGSTHHTLALILWSGGSQQFAFGDDARETEVNLSKNAELPKGAGSFFPLGIEHILIGYDHLLFLLALILRGGGPWSLLKIITAFTVAHSITLALAALDVVALPGTLVESAIALSIAYVALENLFPRFALSRRWTISFLFGLVHGFGFSSVLREIGLPKENLVLSLLNFNLGVEAGQLAVVLVVAPLLMRLRSKSWEPRMVAVISIAILAMGLYWFVERAFFGA